MAQAFIARGHKVTFLVNSAFEGKFLKYGIKEVILQRTTPQPSVQETQHLDSAPVDPIKVFADMIMKGGYHVSENFSLEKLKLSYKSQNMAFFTILYESSIDFNPQIDREIKKLKPDLIVLDHFMIPPSIPKSKIPWINLYSSQPLALYSSDDLPPYGSGYKIDSDRSTWPEFRDYLRKVYGNIFPAYQKKLYAAFDYFPAPEDLLANKDTSFPKSSYLNLYGYPEELDYTDLLPLPEKCLRVDAFSRADDVGSDGKSKRFELPEGFANGNCKLHLNY